MESWVVGGCCGSGNGDFHCAPPSPQLGQLGWVFYYVTVAREVTELSEISFSAGLEWIHRADRRGRSEKEKHCILLASSKPSSFNKPATRGSGGFGDWMVSCQTRWSLCRHHLSHVKVQGKLHSTTEHGPERGLLGWAVQARESRRLPFSNHPRRGVLGRASAGYSLRVCLLKKELPPWCCRGGKSSPLLS